MDGTGHQDRLRVFALDGSKGFGAAVAAHLGTELAAHEERDFEFGEHKSRPLVSVRGRDTYIIHSLAGDAERSANDKLCRLLFLAGALRDAGAAQVTAVAPYLCYARKDRRTKPRDPVTTRYVAAMVEAVGVDRVLTIDVHNLAAFQNAFRRPTEHLEARFALVGQVTALLGGHDVAVVSPDAGGVKRAERFREALASATGRTPTAAFVEKYRSAGVVSGGTLVGDVAGRAALIVDDLIASGTTMARAAAACRDHGATHAYAVATHAVLTDAAGAVLEDPALDGAIVTDTVALTGGRFDSLIGSGRLQVVGVADLFGEAIRRLHEGGSIVDLVEAGS